MPPAQRSLSCCQRSRPQRRSHIPAHSVWPDATHVRNGALQQPGASSGVFFRGLNNRRIGVYIAAIHSFHLALGMPCAERAGDDTGERALGSNHRVVPDVQAHVIVVRAGLHEDHRVWFQFLSVWARSLGQYPFGHHVFLPHGVGAMVHIVA